MSTPNHKRSSEPERTVVGSGVLLDAEATLAQLIKQMQQEYAASEGKWPRDWMQKHVNDQAAIIKVRNILLDRVEELKKLPCRDEGSGYWDCSPLQCCVNPQCADCPQKASNS
jgi:hypothetical protein